MVTILAIVLFLSQFHLITIINLEMNSHINLTYFGLLRLPKPNNDDFSVGALSACSNVTFWLKTEDKSFQLFLLTSTTYRDGELHMNYKFKESAFKYTLH